MAGDRLKLKQIRIAGFKSIGSEGQTIEFGDVTVLLGANGSGKSNIVSFFRMLHAITSGDLQTFVAKQGGADALLHYGAKHTDKTELAVTLEQGVGSDREETVYQAVLVHGMPDRLVLDDARAIHRGSESLVPIEIVLDFDSGANQGPRSDGTFVLYAEQRDGPTTRILLEALLGIRVFHFHDTSDTAKVKSNGYVDDSRYLRSDAGNLAAFLRGMKSDPEKRQYYERIVRHIGKVMPQFGDFDLEPTSGNDRYVRLNWKEQGEDFLFGPHQISDGSLRFMALAALLLQPPDDLPGVIVLDEPELGLHPAAIAELAGMIRTASANAQIVAATQSTRFVDEFGVDNLVVTERDEATRSSVFRRLHEADLAEWLARYSLSELWEKNVLGGRP